MNRLILITLTLLALLIFAAPAFAQETPPVDNLPEIPVVSWPDALALLMAALSSVLANLVVSPVTTGLVALLKRIPALFDTPANILQFIVAAIIAVVWWVALAVGLGPQFQTLYGVLLSILPALAGMFANQAGSAVVYLTARALNVGWFGYQRPAWVHEQRAQRAWARAAGQTVKPYAVPAYAPHGSHDVAPARSDLG